jgi:hypothetical protein
MPRNPQQMHDRRGEHYQAYLWQYGKAGGETVFDFWLGRGREGSRRFLREWSVSRVFSETDTHSRSTA